MASLAVKAFDDILWKQCIQPNLGILLFALCVSCILFLRRWPKRTLPPGPPPLPLLGNIHQTPSKDMWKTYKQWHDKYGPIISMQYGQKTVVSIGSFKVCKDLLDKRSTSYSSRPQLIVANYMNRGLHSGFLLYGERLKAHQALHAVILNPRVVKSYGYVQDIESRQLLHDILQSRGHGFQDIIHRYTYSAVFTLAYGKRFASVDDETILKVDEMAEAVAENLQKPSFLIVEAFPFLDRLPRLLAPWRRMGDHHYEETSQLFESLLQLGRSTSSWNWSKELSKSNDERDALSDTELAFVLGTLVEGNSTADKILEFFIMACVLHQPEFHHAQREIDTVVGTDRLPDCSDAPDLPYVNAFIQEVVRWRPITPLGIPHALVKDDEYRGYHIPKGATIMANNWAMELDDELFPDASEFRPERWLQTPNLPTAAFGFGKRSCPGQHLGRRSLFIVVSRLLWGFNIQHACDENGQKFEIDSSKVTQSSLTGPLPFEASFIVRSPRHQDIIENQFSNSEKNPDAIMDHVHSLVKSASGRL
ncbi:hypothetical protein ASPWEDRAFT_160022 [Aspergillus wentii DTO 134E9]|uniref:Cytochrome P450 n=1 Tax=Aspergillus wentii DTO 134E9 TaxID=1073089 RepID=A0A1L9REF4_ASPWE|nr:uncharacterized protein ASPWEDRAFT_160022 [Aspergillus wentii DTO 134E9]KAI9933567.1 hypothetical protein MW887_008040 [Aspergillus wentii]OJJ33319.1 hypothetical protein ASPWEDRAFT_160022 [Aspergillus wentii DTO 134E9]